MRQQSPYSMLIAPRCNRQRRKTLECPTIGADTGEGRVANELPEGWKPMLRTCAKFRRYTDANNYHIPNNGELHDPAKKRRSGEAARCGDNRRRGSLELQGKRAPSAQPLTFIDSATNRDRPREADGSIQRVVLSYLNNKKTQKPIQHGSGAVPRQTGRARSDQTVTCGKKNSHAFRMQMRMRGERCLNDGRFQRSSDICYHDWSAYLDLAMSLLCHVSTEAAVLFYGLEMSLLISTQRAERGLITRVTLPRSRSSVKRRTNYMQTERASATSVSVSQSGCSSSSGSSSSSSSSVAATVTCLRQPLCDILLQLDSEQLIQLSPGKRGCFRTRDGNMMLCSAPLEQGWPKPSGVHPPSSSSSSFSSVSELTLFPRIPLACEVKSAGSLKPPQSCLRLRCDPVPLCHT
ncbi:unnamed protein product [Pleuronectes platessa]|uniref:Uncharacterized protein n=1 Tax=Pleuronectes platessa TaxID=8262 RepID=A0A9N7UKV6_PLEPL|nr:unnamed protein product [Pleuronectes platessa]